MGLRINHNISALNAARQLRISNTALSKSLERLSSGYRINKGADDPAGLIISEQLRAQITGIKQAVENSQDAVNLIGTAEGALNEINELLRSMRSLALHSSNLATVDTDQIEANQAEIDSAINSIERIANTTKFANKYLLNGAQSFVTSGINSAHFQDLSIDRAQFGDNPNLLVQYAVTQSASYAQITTNITGNLQDNVTIQITGSKGSQQISFASGSTVAQVVNAIQLLAPNTGVSASAVGGAVVFRTQDYGSAAEARVNVIDDGAETFLVGGDTVAVANGQDIGGNINGAVAVGKGTELSVSNAGFIGSLNFEDIQAVTGTSGNFYVTQQGLVFQLGDRTNPNEQESFGIENVNPFNLGVSQGRLSELKTGGQYDMLSDSDQAVFIIDEAINDVSSLRARLGAFEVNTLQTNINSLGVAVENLTSSESRIRDVDFAAETVEFTRAQILVQAGTSIAAQANAATQSVLQLLQ
jgi:flagellin